MKILFSNPPIWIRPQGSLWLAMVRAGSRWPFQLTQRSWPDHFVFGDYLPSPLFLQYATSYCQRECYPADVRFRDSIALRESYESFFKYVERHQFDYLMIETATPSWDHDAKVIEEIHRRCPDTKIVVCGPITATRGTEILEHHPVWACVKGEFEKGSVRAVNGERGLIDFDFLSESEMNKAPWPYMDDVYAERYFDANPVGSLPPQLQVWGTRGCVFRCNFCSWPAVMTGNDPTGEGKRSFRYYSEDYMLDYLTAMTKRYPFRSIYFDSDTENAGTKHTEAMCRVIKKVGLPTTMMCRADTIKMETWDVMKASGIVGVKLGFESGSQFVVDKIVNKHLDLEYAASVVRHLKSIGMSVHGTFSIGHPGETKEQMQETMAFIRSLPFDTTQLSGVAELEGTPLHTLRSVGHMDKYPGAKMDEGYRREVDGNVKMHQLVKELQGA